MDTIEELSLANEQLKRQVESLSRQIDELVPAARKNALGRNSFELAVKGMSKNEVIEYIGRPSQTSDYYDDSTGVWFYYKLTTDPVTGKVDPKTVVFFRRGSVESVGY